MATNKVFVVLHDGTEAPIEDFYKNHDDGVEWNKAVYARAAEKRVKREQRTRP